MNTYKNRILSRIKKVGIETTQLAEILGLHRASLYKKIESVDNSWSIQEIAKTLNTLECTFEELFMGQPFDSDNVYIYAERTYNTARYLKKLRALKGVTTTQMYDAIGCTRQNYYYSIRKKQFKIIQIIKIIELLNLKFDQVFVVKTFRFNKDKKLERDESWKESEKW